MNFDSVPPILAFSNPHPTTRIPQNVGQNKQRCISLFLAISLKIFWRYLRTEKIYQRSAGRREGQSQVGRNWGLAGLDFTTNALYIICRTEVGLWGGEESCCKRRIFRPTTTVAHHNSDTNGTQSDSVFSDHLKLQKLAEFFITPICPTLKYYLYITKRNCFC